MSTNAIKIISIITILASTLSGCSSSGYVYNQATEGPIFVKKSLPLSVDQQNQQANQAFTDKGFETEVTDRGVVVYLPPAILFKGASSSISLQAREKISEIAGEINRPYLSNRVIEVSGHTDSIGDAERNLQLSKERAIAAGAELIFSNVDKTRLNTLWFGETAPRAAEINSDGSTNAESQSINRRVEFVVLNPE